MLPQSAYRNGFCTQLDLNDLPKYSPWPQRLLSLEACAIRYKTEDEVVREFEQEKWGPLLSQANQMARPTLDAIEQAHLDLDCLAPCYVNGAFYLATRKWVLEKHLDLYAAVIEQHLDGAKALVELGAGYGSKLLSLAGRDAFTGMPLAAAEYTQSGRELIAVLAAAAKTPVRIGYCDFRRMQLADVDIPEDSVIFTSYAVHYVPQLTDGFIEFLGRLKPKAVIHFEPCYEFYPTNTMHGLMCRRYVEMNDYTRNMVSVLEAARDRGEIAIRMQRNVLGGNPFLPMSVIEWTASSRSALLA